jgi:hypothetical protein
MKGGKIRRLKVGIASTQLQRSPRPPPIKSRYCGDSVVKQSETAAVKRKERREVVKEGKKEGC